MRYRCGRFSGLYVVYRYIKGTWPYPAVYQDANERTARMVCAELNRSKP